MVAHGHEDVVDGDEENPQTSVCWWQTKHHHNKESYTVCSYD